MGATTTAAKTALKQADDGLNGWLQGLITGKGDSPSHIIITAILGVVPGVGQIMDARDIILSVLALVANPANPAAWLDLVINALGCIPGVGDAFKAVFKLAKIGTPLARILDVLPAKMRGNALKWVKEINFGSLSKQIKSAVDDILAGFIHALDSWAVKAIAGRTEVNGYIRQLEDLRKLASQKIDVAMAELQKLHRNLLAQELPKSTGKTSAPRSAPEIPATKKAPALKTDKSSKQKATPKQTKTDQQRQSKQRTSWHSGVLPEHLADYYMPSAKPGFKKINDHGRKREEHDSAKGAGIDHIWFSPLRSPEQPYVVGETKGSLLDSFALLAALPPDLQAKLASLKDEEPFDPAPQASQTPGKVTVPENASDDDLKAKRQGRKVEQGLSSTKTKGMQMSHYWIIENIMGIENKGIVAGQKSQLQKAMIRFRKRQLIEANPPAPYERWIIMETGKQKTRHERKHGHLHEIQRPIIELPNNILWK